MRILGYSRRWKKLQKPIHTTFRFPRKDAQLGRDWYEGEMVQEVYKPRSKEREVLQIARIAKKEAKFLADITHEEAMEDGFINLYDMYEWLSHVHKGRDMFSPINKLTIEVCPYSKERGE